MKKVLMFLLSSIIYQLSSSVLHAANEFTTTYYSTYTISSSGETLVEHTIALQNNLSYVYATEYSFAVTGSTITHLVVTDESSALPTSTEIHGGTTTIHLDIANPAIGKDKVKTLHISYQTTDVVESIGNTLTINIPRLSKSNEAKEYVRTVKVAGVSSLPQFILPNPSESYQEEVYSVFVFRGQTTDALTLLFGESVTYRLDLAFLLKNKEVKRVDSELALPPDTPYQQILLDSLEPAPIDIRIDSDGNYLARYSLKPQEQLEVKAVLYATVTPSATYPDPSLHASLTQADPDFWDTHNDTVKTLASRLKTPEQFYSYLTTNFIYNFDKSLQGTNRLGAVTALADPTNVVCTEFTDTFVALARAVDIPAREINGYAYTTSASLRPLTQATDVLHSWPEYYDSTTKSWLQVDPTWGHTTGGVDYFHKLDFSHITFVRHGREAEYPLPAGVYKDSAEKKSIAVTVVASAPSINNSTHTADGRLYNTGNTAIQDKSGQFIPPYGSVQLSSAPQISLYDKIKQLCANWFSKFFRRPPASS